MLLLSALSPALAQPADGSEPRDGTGDPTDRGGGVTSEGDAPRVWPRGPADPGFGDSHQIGPTRRPDRWPTPLPPSRARDSDDDIDVEIDREEAVRLRDDTSDLKSARDRLQSQRRRGARRTAKDRELDKRIERLEEEIREQEERALQLETPPEELDADPDYEVAPLDPDEVEDEPGDDGDDSEDGDAADEP